jgi:Zn-dependent protease with chaperone function
MRTALLLSGYAAALAWQAPAVLSRLTARGISARLGLAAWLTAMASAVVSAGLALGFLIRAAAAGWSRLAEVVCQSVAGHACAPAVYQGAAFELSLGAIAAVAALAAVVLAWRYGRSVQRAGRQTRAHAQAARITGRGLPGYEAAALVGGAPGTAAYSPPAGAAVVVLDAPEPAAYCLPGRPATIVLSSGALALLQPAQLAAVLAHERAHLAGRHHVLMTLSRGLAACFPGVPLFTLGYQNVVRLAEMCADDAAARRSGRRALIAALLAMATGAPVPARALGTAVCAVTARVQRLIEPSCSAARRTQCCAGITAVMLVLVVLPAAVAITTG